MPLPKILETALLAGHAVFTTGDLNLNIIGVRSKNSQAGKFDDRLEVWWMTSDVWHGRSYTITTDPGKHYLQNPINSGGTAILCAGQYRGAYKVGLHKGYTALVQRKPVTVFRDGNKDTGLDIIGKKHSGMYGINIHCADSNPFDSVDGASRNVGKWSAGCQVFQHPKEYRDFMSLVQMASAGWGPVFSYTLLAEK